MATVNETLQDEYIAHAESLQKYSLGVVRRIIALLNRADADLSAALIQALERMPAESFTVERMELLLGSVRSLNAQAYAAVQAELTKDLAEFAAYEAGWQMNLFARALPGSVKVSVPLVQVTADQVYAAAMSRPFQGRLLREWASKVEADRMVAVRNAIRTGYVEGKTTADIVRSIRGSRANSYADGFLQRPRKDLEAVVRTAISHTASTARAEFNKANADLIKADKWTATLDTKTSPQCRIRDQKQYTAIDHKPIGHKIPWLAGPGKIHWNCRSVSTPVTKSWRELGIPIDEMSPGERASMDGQVPADTTYSEWLSRQSAARQERVLGPMRYRLLQEGKISMDELYTPTGEFRTIDQLIGSDRVEMARIAA